MSTQLVFSQPDPLLIENINSNCQLQVKVFEAIFLKDEGDLLGKQDPYLAFKYQDKEVRTKVQDGAGKEAKFDDVFILDNIESSAKNGKELVMEAWEYDLDANDLLGICNPLTF